MAGGEKPTIEQCLSEEELALESLTAPSSKELLGERVAELKDTIESSEEYIALIDKMKEAGGWVAEDGDYLSHDSGADMLGMIGDRIGEELQYSYYIDILGISVSGDLVSKLRTYRSLNNAHSGIDYNDAEIRKQAEADLSECIEDATSN